MWQHMLAHHEDAFEVVIDLCIPNFLAHFYRSACCRSTDVVDQHVDATKAFQSGFHGGLNRCGLGDVARHRRDFTLAYGLCLLA